MTNITGTTTSAITSQIAASGTTATASNTGALSKLSGNLDSFLKILTTQLKNQNPLEPLKTEDFTNQLVLYTQAEQQISTNSKLDQLIALNQNKVTSELLGYVGKTVEVSGNNFYYTKGETNVVKYTLPENARSATIAFYNSENKLVASFDAEKTKGTHEFTFTGGRAPDGTIIDSGTFTTRVTAPDSTGKKNLDVTYSTINRVDGTVRENGKELLTFGKLNVNPSAVVSVLNDAGTGSINTGLLNYLGKSIEAQSDIFYLDPSDITAVSYNLPANYSSVQNISLAVLNLDGTIAQSRLASVSELTSGTHYLGFNSATIFTSSLPTDKTYRFAILRPNNASSTFGGQLPPINIGNTYTTRGLVTSVDGKGVNIGTLNLTADKIMEVTIN